MDSLPASNGTQDTPPDSHTSRQAYRDRQWRTIFWAAVIVAGIVMLSSAVFTPFGPDQFIYLARSFAQGRLSVDEMPLIYPDYVIWQGHTYLPSGPLPAILLIPFLPLLDIGLQAGWIGVLVTLLNIWLFYRVLTQIGVIDERRNWALLLFFGGTVYFAVAVTLVSWYLAHLLTVTWILLAVAETLGNRRPGWIGLWLGLALMTRLSAVFTLPFFLWMLWNDGSAGHNRLAIYRYVRNIRYLIIGISSAIGVILLYNYVRFGNSFETGYGIDVLGSSTLEQARAYGLFSPIHIPKNLFMLLFQGPLPYPSADAPVLEFPYVQPTRWGMGIFFTSPALLYAFRVHFSDRLVQSCSLAIVCVLIPLLTHYGIGWIQFGYRYSLDFLPFLLLLAVRAFPNPLTNLARSLIIVSVLVNLWGTFWLEKWLQF